MLIPKLSVILIDNFDSFTFNLVDEFKKFEADVFVYRNTVTLEYIIQKINDLPEPKLLVISPGPGTPETAGIGIDLTRAMAGKIPIFGICLGHQILASAFDGEVERAALPMHGKTSHIYHDASTLFKNIPNPITVGRYHSLVVTKTPIQFKITAQHENTIMAIEHEIYPIYGIQFHPESILTPVGSRLILNLIRSIYEVHHYANHAVS
jgi:anthranilate synthase/aminodeoxychorismate synthase-like glutamine amidotransferase